MKKFFIFIMAMLMPISVSAGLRDSMRFVWILETNQREAIYYDSRTLQLDNGSVDAWILKYHPTHNLETLYHVGFIGTGREVKIYEKIIYNGVGEVVFDERFSGTSEKLIPGSFFESCFESIPKNGK